MPALELALHEGEHASDACSLGARVVDGAGHRFLGGQIGADGLKAVDREGFQWMPAGYSLEVPEQAEAAWLNDNTPWWGAHGARPKPQRYPRQP